MTTTLVHELASQTPSLLERLRRVLGEQGGGEAEKLLARARVEVASKPRMVVTGQYSSGKSSLIKALTDGAIEPKISADIATDRVTEYDWDGAVILVDTPGVQSGLRSHDDLAMEAIGNADFVLFVITVNLFDDAARDFLRHLANDLSLHGQMVLVITQTGKQASGAAELRQQAVRDALGTSAFTLLIAEVDSVYYMRSLEGGPRSEALRSRSGIDGLRAKINQISVDTGQIAQLRQPLHLIRQLCDEAEILFTSDGHARAALALLANQRQAVFDRRYYIEQEFSTAESSFKSACLTDVTAFVDTVTSLPPDEEEAEEVRQVSESRLVEALERHAAKFARDVNVLTQAQFAKLESQMTDIADSNRALSLLRPNGEVSIDAPSDLPAAHGSVGYTGLSSPGIDWREIGKWLQQGQKWWGAGDGIKVAAGGNGHKVVLDVGHRFGAKFKPWQAVKIANTIGKAARVAGFAIQAGSAIHDVYANEREARRVQLESERLHRAFVTEIMGHADEIAADARRSLWESIDPPMNEFLAEVTARQEAILRGENIRIGSAAEIDAIAREAERLLALV